LLGDQFAIARSMGIVWMANNQMNKVGFYFCEDVIIKYGFWHCTHSEYLSNLLQNTKHGQTYPVVPGRHFYFHRD
jgi:hypothetical protein